MSSGPASTRRESVWISIALAPLRAIERTRGWRRIGLLALYGLIALVGGAFLWRRSQLAALPDIGEPFDVAAFRSRGRESDDRNAFGLYRQAVARYRDMNQAESASFTNANLTWMRADATFRGWVSEHEQAIALMQKGSERPECTPEIPSGQMFQTTAADNNVLAARIGWIGTAALFKAGRLRDEGDSAAAWALFKAVVRASRHIEWAVGALGGRTSGIMMLQYARQPVTDWANDPAVSTAMLRHALDDLTAAEALTPPLSAGYRMEYLGAVDSLTNGRLIVAARDRQSGTGVLARLGSTFPNLNSFLQGEPERSRRVLNLLIANDLAWCDRPLAERPGLALTRLRIYAVDPAAPATKSSLAPEELARWADSALITSTLSWRPGQIDELEKIDRWSMNSLVEPVVVSLFIREMGRPPASPAEAFKRYRASPGDSPSRDEANPLP